MRMVQVALLTFIVRLHQTTVVERPANRTGRSVFVQKPYATSMSGTTYHAVIPVPCEASYPEIIYKIVTSIFDVHETAKCVFDTRHVTRNSGSKVLLHLAYRHN